MLNVSNLCFSYPESQSSVLNDVSFSIKKGDYTVILGTNGSGKSTLARIIAGFLSPDSGTVDFDKNLMNGIVFQSPKEQVVSGIVNHDTAFGPKNLGLPQDEVEQRVIECLSATDLLDKALSSTNALSLGQTQKLATSGILALHPDLLILDEATSMLDPESRKELLDFIDSSHQRGQTIIHITHDYSEALKSNHVIVLEKGRLIYDDSTENFKNHSELIENLFGTPIPQNPRDKIFPDETVLELKDICFSYDADKKSETKLPETISHYNLKFKKGTLNAITGPSGSGKSTILELAAGLLIPESGEIFCEKRPALCLQDAQSALFEAFAADDVAFGPRNQGIKGKELKRIVKESMNAAGVPFEQFADRGTFMLSGGEKRKVAVAGILAMNSDVVLFDEPTAGLDPKSRKNLVEQLKKLTETGKTVIFSTHRMDEAAFADRQIDMKNGKIIRDSEKDLSTSVEVTTRISSDTTAISSDTTVISSDTTVISSDTTAISSGTSVISSGVEKSLPTAPAVQGTSLLKILRKTELFSEDPMSHKKNIFQKIGPTAKYCIFLSIFVLSLLFNNLYLSIGMVGISLLYGALARFPAKKYFSSFFVVLPWLLFFCAFQMIVFIPEENDIIYAQWGRFTITLSKIIACINLILHTFSALCSARVFLYSTGEREFLEGISGLLKPFTAIHLPTKGIIVIVEIIFRFIPLLIEESCSIVKTQIVRGGLGNAKSLWAKIKILIPLFIPLIIQTVKRSEALADALTARKF